MIDECGECRIYAPTYRDLVSMAEFPCHALFSAKDWREHKCGFDGCQYGEQLIFFGVNGMLEAYE